MGKHKQRSKKKKEDSPGINLNSVVTLVKDAEPPAVIHQLFGNDPDERGVALQSISTIIMEDPTAYEKLSPFDVVKKVLQMCQEETGEVRAHAYGTLRNLFLIGGEPLFEEHQQALAQILVDPVLSYRSATKSEEIACIVEAVLLITHLCETIESVVNALSQNTAFTDAIITMSLPDASQNDEGRSFVRLAVTELLYVLTEDNDVLVRQLRPWAEDQSSRLRQMGVSGGEPSVTDSSQLRHNMLIAAVVFNVLGQEALLIMAPLGKCVLNYDVAMNIQKALSYVEQQHEDEDAFVASVADTLRSLNVFLELASNAIAECDQKSIWTSPVCAVLGGPESGEAVRNCILGLLSIFKDARLAHALSFDELAEHDHLQSVAEVLHGAITTATSVLCNLSNVVPLGSVGFSHWEAYMEALCRDLSLAMSCSSKVISVGVSAHIGSRIESLAQLCLDVALGEQGAGSMSPLPTALFDVLLSTVKSTSARWITPRVRCLLVSLLGVAVTLDRGVTPTVSVALHQGVVHCPIPTVAWECANVLMDIFSDEAHDQELALSTGLFRDLSEMIKRVPSKGEEWDDEEEAHMDEVKQNVKRFIVYKHEMHKGVQF